MGDGSKIRFWEDLWFGNCSLVIQYWSIYTIVNEQGKTIREIWDGVNLKLTFRRTVDHETLNQWEEHMQIASNIQLSEDDDVIV
jgi:hypothetical protein